MILTLDEQLLLLARRTLHTAYVWNDHNCDPAHEIAKRTAQACAINNVEEAEAFLQRVVGRGPRIL